MIENQGFRVPDSHSTSSAVSCISAHSYSLFSLQKTCDWILLVNWCNINSQPGMYDQCENTRKLELGPSSQLRTTLRIHVLQTPQSLSSIILPQLKEFVCLNMFSGRCLCQGGAGSISAWASLRKKWSPLLETSEILQYFSFCYHLTLRNVVLCCVPVSLYITS